MLQSGNYLVLPEIRRKERRRKIFYKFRDDVGDGFEDEFGAVAVLLWSTLRSLLDQDLKKKQQHTHKHICLIICCLNRLQSLDAPVGQKSYHSAFVVLRYRKEGKEKKSRSQAGAGCHRLFASESVL